MCTDGFPQAKGHKLNHTNRPEAVDYWLKCGRPKQKTPDLGELEAYGERVRLWWRGVQPEWRSKGDSWPMSRALAPNESWSGTAKGGLNGIFMVLMSLVWWRLSARSEGERGEVLSMVEDVTWVLRAMHEQLDKGGPMIEELLERGVKGKKRGKENDGNAALRKKRYVLCCSQRHDGF